MFWANFRAAFRDVWSQVGIVISAVAIFSFLVRQFRIDPSPLLWKLLEAFRSISHPVMDFLTGWLPFELSSIQLDGMVLYAIGGGAVARTFLALTSAVGGQHVHADPLLNWSIGSPLKRLLGAIGCGVLWPIALIEFFRRPIVIRFQAGMYGETRKNWRLFRKRMLRRDPASRFERANNNRTFDHDLRATFALQLAATLSVVFVMVLQSAAGGSP